MMLASGDEMAVAWDRDVDPTHHGENTPRLYGGEPEIDSFVSVYCGNPRTDGYPYFDYVLDPEDELGGRWIRRR